VAYFAEVYMERFLRHAQANFAFISDPLTYYIYPKVIIEIVKDLYYN